MPATAAARRVAASPARRATAGRTALKTRPRATPARRAPARAPGRNAPAGPGTRAKAAPQRRRGRSNTPVSGFVPVVVGRTAGAVGGIADSGFVVRMTKGRLWIGVLGALLVGIVALNVWALSLNSSSSRVAHQTDGLKRANSALQAQIVGELSNEQVQATASKLGLIVPEPGAIRYLDSGSGAAAIAARRLADGALTLGTVPPETAPVAPVAPVATETAPVATEDPAAAPAAPVAAEPVAPVAPAATAAGGVVAP